MTKPPRLAAWLLRVLIPERLSEPIAGDLEEDWNAGARLRPFVRHRRYWRLTCTSILDCWLTLTFSAGLSLLASLLVGVLPAIHVARRDAQSGLKEGASAGGRQHRRLRTGLVALEVAMSVLLLVAAGLLVRTYQNLNSTGPGFDPDSVVTLAVSLPAYRYPDANAQRQFFEQSVERVSVVPGVTAAGFLNVLPFSTYDRGTRFVIDGAPAPEPGREPSAAFRRITPRYFDALRIPVRAGRAFTDADRDSAQRVAIVNDALARRFFEGKDPLGARLTFLGNSTPLMTIVGIVGDVRHSQISEPPSPELYVPFAQSPTAMMMLAARTSTRPESAVAAVRSAVQAVDPNQPVFHVKTMAVLVGESLAPRTSAMQMVSLFGAVALLLAGIGIYGVISYVVNQQTREIGVRMALGAQPRDVARHILVRGLVPVATGLTLGLFASVLAMRLMSGLLFGVSPFDPLTYVVVAAILVGVGIMACLVPARRAMRVDPVGALRAE